MRDSSARLCSALARKLGRQDTRLGSARLGSDRYRRANSSMGFLDKLWDDTVAGPQPEKGLGRLRKESSFRQGAMDVPGACLLNRLPAAQLLAPLKSVVQLPVEDSFFVTGSRP